LTGQTPEEYAGFGWLAPIHPEDRDTVSAIWSRSLQTRQPYDVEYRLRAQGGEYRWYHVRGVPIVAADGSVREWIGVCIDIHERKAAEERQQLLMAELDHRVRNILASIRSMVVMTSRGAGTKQEQAESLQGRVDAMARAHGLLTRQRWKGASLGQLLRDELEAYASRGDAVVLQGEGDWILRPQQALNFALVIHELATNAAKYGALSAPTGRVTVTWTVELDQDPARLRIVWQESGGPLVRQPERQGFGSRLILNALRQDEGSEVKLDYDPAGVRCEFSIPVRRGLTATAPRETLPQPVVRSHDGLTLKAARILLVEDEMLVGLEMRHALAEAGADVIGPVPTTAEASRLAEEANLSAAVLDVNLGGDMIDPVAARLLARGIPFVFVTGYDARRVLPEALRGAPALRKPIDAAVLVEALNGLLTAQPEPQRAS
jgi:PAS domain S-box-containing protein